MSLKCYVCSSSSASSCSKFDSSVPSYASDCPTTSTSCMETTEDVNNVTRGELGYQIVASNSQFLVIQRACWTSKNAECLQGNGEHQFMKLRFVTRIFLGGELVCSCTSSLCNCSDCPDGVSAKLEKSLGNSLRKGLLSLIIGVFLLLR